MWCGVWTVEIVDDSTLTFCPFLANEPDTRARLRFLIDGFFWYFEILQVFLIPVYKVQWIPFHPNSNICLPHPLMTLSLKIP